ncbi:MAG TPA: sortase [Propionibacteriaceae bacterium]|nr:sortase [Propionibacteriaceae bacterium]
MDSPALGVLAATAWFVVHLGYVLLAGVGTFWTVVWPEGQSVRRLRALAFVGLALTAIGTVAEALVDRTAPGLLVRLALLAIVGFYGAELLRNPVRGPARPIVIGLIVVLTATLVVDSAMATPQAAVITATTGIYLLALAAWLGGLVALASLLRTRDRSGRLDQVWSRFARLAGLSVLALAVTGAVQHLVVSGTATSRSGVLLLVEGLVLVATLLLSRYAVTLNQRLAFRERYLPGSTVVTGGRPSGDGEAIGLRGVLSAALIAAAVAQLALLPIPGRPAPPPLGDPVPTVPTSPVATVREARPAASDRSRFAPERIDLPDGASADVVPVATVGRELVVPEEPGKVGWWDGSSYVGDDYGSTVIAGHVDTLDRGVGFFVRLWKAEVGERIVVSAGNARQAYTITKLRQVPRTDLVDDEEVFAIDGPPRLVLITCTGEFRPERGGYSRNLVVVASPVP